MAGFSLDGPLAALPLVVILVILCAVSRWGLRRVSSERRGQVGLGIVILVVLATLVEQGGRLWGGG